MNDSPNRPENEDAWDMRVQQAARQFTYPPTPNIASQLRLRTSSRLMLPRRALQVAVVLLIIALASVIAVPEIRAGVLEFLRIGGIRILQIEPTATTTPNPNFTPTPLPSVLNLPNETTLEHARVQVTFPMPLPTYPADVGLPDHVYLQDDRFDLVSLVWLEPAAPERVWFSLHIMTSHGFAEKGYVQNIQETEVNGQWAVWLTQPHPIEFELSGLRGGHVISWMIRDNVLLWEGRGGTYRLEGDLTLEEAQHIAESLE